MLALGLAQLLNGKTANFRVFLSIILIIAIIIDIYRLRVTNYKEYVILGFFSIILVGTFYIPHLVSFGKTYYL